MKFLVALALTSTFAMAAPSEQKKTLPVKKEEKAVKEHAALQKIKALDKKEEDCDEKAKKPVEIKPESISLSGNAGCSLDEAH